MGRNTQGVSLIKLKGDDAIAAVSKIEHEEEEEEDATENSAETAENTDDSTDTQSDNNNIEEQSNNE